MDYIEQIFLKEEVSEIRRFQRAMIIFFVGQIILIISTLSFATSINGIPNWFKYLQYLAYITYFAYFIALFLIRKINNSFFLSMCSVIIFAIIYFLEMVCKTSTNQIFLSLGKGLSWSADILLCFTYLFFFNGCFMIFSKYKFLTGKKRARVAYIVFLALFILANIAEYLTTTRLVMGSMIARRVTLYGGWALRFFMYSFNFFMIVSANWYLNHKLKDKKEAESHEDQ